MSIPANPITLIPVLPLVNQANLTLSKEHSCSSISSAPLQIRNRYGSPPVRVYSYEVQEQANQSMGTEVSMLVTSLRVLTTRAEGSSKIKRQKMLYIL